MPARGLRVGGLAPLTTIDYPGELAAVIFCQGCPWRCSYCHNPELIPARGEGNMAWGEVMAWLQGRRGLLDAVVFSGGEPTLQPALPAAVDAVAGMGFKVGLHSAGPYPDRLAALLPRIDWIGLDVKALPEEYPALTGVPGSGKAAWESARRVIAHGLPHEMRITEDPRHLTPDGVAAIEARLQALGARRVVRQPCLPVVTAAGEAGAAALSPAAPPPAERR
ncbi:anaerobic ribonucleoside-triphosphate reductase activating protein [Ectothiorhodospira mobilis]|uniref:anaerobic ribonucleoside-triphosphate reductase activating protein n=1 Tax=Ectothiorhodospira mobilis TaxID=195064 RepID=UPI0019057E2A|nr:anaerobic ribonucleoside-triphosphate reductase activating protein [Ectothiorhodospira mobilis]MBK1693073.1 anaerobic ribonucleoside-triphosphate reductase activating protein [Ectothiorhodospira mobilis]